MKLIPRICITAILIFGIFASLTSCASHRESSQEERESLNNALAGVEVTEKPDADEEINYDEYDLVSPAL